MSEVGSSIALIRVERSNNLNIIINIAVASRSSRFAQITCKNLFYRKQ